MIHLKWIEISGFKGIENLRCEFEDLTLLTGVNNAGKTSVLQAVHLLLDFFERLRNKRPANWTLTEQNQTILGAIGILKPTWVLSERTGAFRIAGEISSGHSIAVRRHNESQLIIQVDDFASNEEELETPITARMFRPPGILPSKEPMLQPLDFNQKKVEGNSQNHWRNSIWWGIQNDGQESFEPIKRLVESHFPGLTLKQPRLSASENNTSILIEYFESVNPDAVRDIAQSGAGLHTFVSLAQVIEQANTQVVLLDEPDSHLHGTQQEVVVRLLSEIAESRGRQVVIATHSAEMISRVPEASLRWLTAGSSQTEGIDRVKIYEELGISVDAYLNPSSMPDVIVYVEGKKDKPLVENLIKWCRNKRDGLPSTAVVHHKDGRFNGPSLQAIARVATQLGGKTRVVGIRDLDFYYSELENLIKNGLPKSPLIRDGDSYVMITLACKEMENLCCLPDHLEALLAETVGANELRKIIYEASGDEDLVEHWMHRAKPEIRKLFDSTFAEPSKEKETDAVFASWASNESIRTRYVGGKKLLGIIRERLRSDLGIRIPSNLIPMSLSALNDDWLLIASKIFPAVDWNTQQ